MKRRSDSRKIDRSATIRGASRPMQITRQQLPETPVREKFCFKSYWEGFIAIVIHYSRADTGFTSKIKPPYHRYWGHRW